jgi:hypothetical protein
MAASAFGHVELCFSLLFVFGDDEDCLVLVVVVFAWSHSLSTFFLLCPIAMGCVRKPSAG